MFGKKPKQWKDSKYESLRRKVKGKVRFRKRRQIWNIAWHDSRGLL